MFVLVNINGRLRFVRKGLLTRLPAGYRFQPTDQELILHYLRNKVMSCLLPPHFIPELDVWNSDPWDLKADSEQEMYCFCNTKRNDPNRGTGSGFWRAVGIDKQIVVPARNQVVGMKKTLVFYKGKPENCSITNWMMHEYRLAGEIRPVEGSSRAAAAAVPMENWVLCKVFLKEEEESSDDDDDDDELDSSEVTSDQIPSTHEPDEYDDAETSSSSR